MIGTGGTTRFEPGANEPGVYESIDGGNTFKEVWDGAKPDPGISFGITDVGLDPLNPDVVYAAGFDAGVWRRDAGAAPDRVPAGVQAAVQPGAGIDRTMFALTSQERAHADLPDRRHGRGGGPTTRSRPTSGGPTTASAGRGAARVAGAGAAGGHGLHSARPGDDTFPAVVHAGGSA